MQRTSLSQTLETPGLQEQNIPMRLDEITEALRMAGLVDADTPASLRGRREAGPALFNPLDGFAPMVSSVPQQDR